LNRHRLSGVLVALATLLLIAATVAGYARWVLLDSDRFADRATASVQDENVRTLIADRVTDEVILRQQADLVTARPIISSAVAGIVGGRAFGSLFRRGVLDAHRAVFARDRDTIALTVADVGTVAAAAVREVRPKVAAEVEASGRISLFKERIGSVSGDLLRVGERVRALAFVLAALTLVVALAALAVSVDRRHTAARLGLGAVVAGVVIVVAYTIARGVVLGHVDGTDEHAAAGAIWDAYLQDLRAFGWLLAGSGAVVAAAASSLLRPVAIEGPLRAVWRWATTEPARPWLRLVRAGALIAAGLLVIVEPLAALQVATTLVGVYLLYSGVTEVLRLVYRPAEPVDAPVRRRRPWGRRLAVPLLAALLVGAGTAVFVAGGGASAPPAATSACNGSATLCDRPLDEVVLPATHNSMSAPLEGWFSSQQDRGIAGQLEDGVRGLLIDTHDADELPNGRVRTYFASRSDLSAAIKQDGVSEGSYKAALRLRERLGFSGAGTRGIYLCHTFCELGATPLSDALEDIHDFLVTHPAEVVVVVNQDYVSPADFVEAVGDAGLTRYALTPPTTSSWPTLREMIDDDRRLVVLAENRAGAAPWYRLAYERLLEETPYSFDTPAQLADDATSCKANRGPTEAPLFLINNWVTTDPVPRPSNAAEVNAYATLLARARACQRRRDQLPNLLAVDFYKRGDLFRVVDTLNGTG
jgi:hypothetical protein